MIQTLIGTTTVFIGEYYQVSGSSVTKYYSAGAQQVAVRTGSDLRYVFADHLASSTVTADVNGANVLRQLYKGWGETRSTGTVGTRYAYTGQYRYDDQATEFGLLFYRSRFYDGYLNRWIQPDSIIPDPNDPQSYDRFSYVRNNPVNRVDPSGHADICPECGDGGDLSDEERLQRVRELQNPTPPPPEENPTRQTAASVLYLLANMTQDIATLIDLGFSIGEVYILAIGLSAGPESIPVVIGGMDIIYNLSGGNLAETLFSGASLILTATADTLDDGQRGDATITSLCTFTAGLLVPDPMADLVIDGYASGYNHGVFAGITEIMPGAFFFP